MKRTSQCFSAALPLQSLNHSRRNWIIGPGFDLSDSYQCLSRPLLHSSTSSFPAGNKFSRTSSDICISISKTFSKRRFPSPMWNEEEEESFAASLSWSGMREGVEVMPMPTAHAGGGVGKNGGSGGGDDGSGGGNGRNKNINDYYQKMIASYPEDPLILGNYARFLKEVEGDEVKAEENCERAIMVESSDGNVLSLYGDLIWQKDKNSARAKPFFDQAVQSSPDDCYVLAAYAKFLWEGGDDEDDTTRYSSPSPTMAAPT